MTESEARSKIKYRLETARQIAGNGVDGKAFEDLEIAVQVLKEIREYREIGKAEEIKKCIHSLATSCDELKDMLTKYEAIGTVEELQAYKLGDCMNDCEHYDNCSNYIYSKGYNKAIDDLVKAIKEHTTIAGTTYMCDIVLLAEQMKGGATDERTGSN